MQGRLCTICSNMNFSQHYIYQVIFNRQYSILNIKSSILPALFTLISNQVSEQPVSSRYAGRQFPEEYQSRINKSAFAITGNDEASVLFFFSRIFHAEDTFIAAVDIFRIIN